MDSCVSCGLLACMKKAWQRALNVSRFEFATGTSVLEVASAAPAAQHGQSAYGDLYSRGREAVRPLF
jgi:hypothetical protein